MLQAIKLTFGSVWGWLGIIVGAISLTNLGVMYFDVGIGPVLERVVATYKAIVHTGFDYLFFWVDWKMPPWSKDIASIYLILGAASMRSEKQLRMSEPMFFLHTGSLTKFDQFLQSLFSFFVWFDVFASLWSGGGARREILQGKIGSTSFRKAIVQHRIVVILNLVTAPLAAFLIVVTTSGLQ